MNLKQILLILRARYKLILFTLVVTVVSAIVIAWTMPSKYKASTTLVLDFKSIDPITGNYTPVPFVLASYMATELDILESNAVALRVVKDLKLAEDERTKKRFEEADHGKGSLEDWLVAGLRSKLKVQPSKESRIIEVNFTNDDPEYAAKVANAFAQAYIQTNLEMKVAPARASATWFDDQIKQLRTRVEEAQGRLSKYQTEKGITSTDQRLDVETAKLAEISSQLVQIQAQAYEYASRQKQLQEFTSRNRSVDSLPEVLSSPLIPELKARLSMAESRLSQASNTMGVNHPEYQRAQSEVTSLRKKLRDEVNTAASVIGNNLRITQSRESELRDAVAAQKTRLLELNRRRDELGVLTKEVENAQHVYDSASQRYTQASLESQMDQGNVKILSRATPPLEPSFPKMRLILALSVAVGCMMGMSLALLAELIDRRVRGVDDLQELVGSQVWGALVDTSELSRMINRKSKKAIGRKRFPRPLQEPTLG